MKKNKINFEKNFERLNTIVEIIESGNVALEENLKLYKEGMALAAECAEILQQAEQQVSILTQDLEGIYSKQPFEPQD